MKKKFFCLLTIIFLTIIFCSISSSVFAVDHTVGGSNFQNINNTISSANSGDRILLGTSTYTGSGSIISLNNNKNLTIQGQSNSNRATLNANNLHGILYVQRGSSATIRYVNFVNGGSTGCALGIDGTVLIENCNFINSRGDSGAAVLVYESAANTIIRNCNFTNNYANNQDINNYTTGGAVCINGADNVEIRNCYFSGNRALNIGGALTIREGATNTKIINCNFINNQAPNGGAIYSQVATTIISNCTFTNNKASNIGGVIYSLGNLTIVNSIFNKNTAKNGGAIYTRSNDLNFIKNSKFTDNSGKYGGAIYNGGTLIIQSSTFESNKASSYGGAIYALRNLNITGSNINKNSAVYGSAVYNLATLWMSKVNINLNIAKVIGIYLKYPISVKASKKISINIFLKTGDNINGGIYNKKGNTYINGIRKNPLTYTPSKTFKSNIGGIAKNIKSDSKGIATRIYTVPKNIKKFTVYASYSQNGEKWLISKSILVNPNAQGIVKVATKSKPNNIKSPTTTITTKKTINPSSKNNGASVKVSFLNHEYSHLTSLVNTDVYRVNSKKISYWNIKEGKNLIRVTDYLYKVDKNGWYYGIINTKNGIDWKKSGGKPSISGTWFNLSPSSKDKYSINKKVSKFTNDTSNIVLMFFVSAKTTINHSSLTPYISYSYNLTNKKDKSKKTVKFFEKADSSIYLEIDESSKSFKDYNKYLVNSNKSPTNSKEIISLTKTIISKISGELTPTKKSTALFIWVRDNIAYPKKSYQDTVKKATGALSSKVANCVDQSHLLVSMLRVAKIPSKYEHFKPCVFSTGTIVGHVWVSIYTNGKWVEVDTTSRSNSYGKIVSFVKAKGGINCGPYINVPF